MTPRDRRALLLGGMVVLGAVFFLRVLPAGARALVGARERAEARVALLAAARQNAARLPLMRDSLARVLAGFDGLAPRLIDGRSSADAAASLGAMVSHRAGTAALRVSKLDVLPDSAPGAFAPVVVRGAFEGDIRGLTAFLAALETGNPLLSVDAMNVSAPNLRAEEKAPEILRIEVTVRGWYMPGKTGPRDDGAAR